MTRWMKNKWLAGTLALLLLLGATVYQTEALTFVDLTASGHWLVDWIAHSLEWTETMKDYAVQAKMLLAWGQALKSMNIDLLVEMGGPLGDVMSLWQNAHELFFDAALIKAQFDDLYKEPFKLDVLLPGAAYFDHGFDWNEATREAQWLAMQQQGRLTLSLQATDTSISKGLTASRQSTGHLQAAQASNLLLGTLGAQLQTLNTIMGTMAHAESQQAMMETAIRDQAMKRLDYATSDLTRQALKNLEERTQGQGCTGLPEKLGPAAAKAVGCSADLASLQR